MHSAQQTWTISQGATITEYNLSRPLRIILLGPYHGVVASCECLPAYQRLLSFNVRCQIACDCCNIIRSSAQYRRYDLSYGLSHRRTRLQFDSHKLIIKNNDLLFVKKLSIYP